MAWPRATMNALQSDKYIIIKRRAHFARAAGLARRKPSSSPRIMSSCCRGALMVLSSSETARIEACSIAGTQVADNLLAPSRWHSLSSLTIENRRAIKRSSSRAWHSSSDINVATGIALFLGGACKHRPRYLNRRRRPSSIAVRSRVVVASH